MIKALAIAAIVGLTSTGVAEETTFPDKCGYTLFNPTPDEFMRELSADRPDETDCPFTVDAGHFQLEMDFANLTYDGFSSAEIAPMNVKIGLLNNLDFQLVYTPYRWERIQERSQETTKSGFDGITPRFKLNLIGNDGGFFALALIPFLKLPLTQDGLGNGSVEGGLGIPYAFDVPGWDLGFQSTFRFNRNEAGGGYHSEFDNSVSIGRRIAGKLSGFAEFFSNVSTERGASWVGTVDIWLTYQLSKNLRLDGGVYIGVTHAADDWHPWIGMTWRY